mgnify:CR=1 FL=1
MRKWVYRVRTMPFKQKLILYSLFLSLIPVLVVGSVSASLASRSIQNEVDQSHQRMLTDIQRQLSRFMVDLQIASIDIATNLAVEKSVREGPTIDHLDTMIEMNEAVRRIRSTSSIPYNVTIVYRRYSYMYSNFYDEERLSRYHFDTILEKMKSENNSTDSFVVPVNTFENQPEMLLFRPIPIYTSYTEAYLVLHVDPEYILSFLGGLDIGHRTKLIVVDEAGRIVISGDRSEMGKPLSALGELETYWREGPRAPSSVTIDGETYRLSLHKSSVNDWTYMAMTPMVELTRQSAHIRTVTWIIVGVLATVWMALALIGSRRLYFPIERLYEKLHLWHKNDKKRTGDGLADLDDLMHQLIEDNRKLLHQLNEQAPYLKQSMLQLLVRGELTEREFFRLADRYNVDAGGTAIYVCLAEVDRLDEFHESYREKDRALIHYALLKVIEEVFQPFAGGIAFSPQTGQVVLIVGCDDASEAARSALLERADEARAQVNHYFRFTVSFAVVGPLDGYGQVAKGYEEAVALINQRIVLGDNVTIAGDEADVSLTSSGRRSVELQKKIVFHLLHGNIDEARRLLKEMIAEWPASKISPETIRSLFSYMIGELDYMLQQTGCDIHQVAGVDLYKHLYRLRSLPQLEDWLSNQLFPAVKAHLDEQTASKQSRTVKQVVEYIRERIGEDLSLQILADRFQLSVSYLSRLFKQETGKNFIDFVLELRMNKAKQWLEHTDMPIKEIAAKLSYTSVPNFNRVFKQHVGIPPGE